MQVSVAGHDDIDVALCESAIDAQALAYTLSANTPSAIGVAIDAIAAFIAAGKGTTATVVAAILAIDGTVKAAIAIDNTNKIAKAAKAAKAKLCKCQTE